MQLAVQVLCTRPRTDTLYKKFKQRYNRNTLLVFSLLGSNLLTKHARGLWRESRRSDAVFTLRSLVAKPGYKTLVTCTFAITGISSARAPALTPASLQRVRRVCAALHPVTGSANNTTSALAINKNSGHVRALHMTPCLPEVSGIYVDHCIC